MGNSMTETTDILVKKAALKGIEAAMNIYMTRVEGLAVEYAALGSEIAELENLPPGGTA
jgi:hypothetical protein